MKRTKRFKSHDVVFEKRSDGAILLTAREELGPVVEKTGQWLHDWAKKTPDQVFLAERYGPGWREETYQSTLQKVQALGASLLGRGFTEKTPILIMSGNGVDHGLLSLAAQYVGVPTVPVAEQYSLIHGAHERLRHAIELIRPKMAYVVDAIQYDEALKLEALNGIEIVASRTGGKPGVTAFDDLLKGDGSVDLKSAYAEVGADSIAKILMTSGSTSNPKGVLTTQLMMCTNQTQIQQALPFLCDRPPVIVDWLPWNHVFGGSHNFNMMLANGGSFYIDDGKPVKGLFDRTIENLKLQTGSLLFNVPVGFDMLVAALGKDDDLRQRFFSDLDLIFYAGASLPQNVWSSLENMALEVKGEIPLMTSSWGLTETAPACLMQQEPTPQSGIVGVPLSGLSVKLIPDDEMRCEIRVKGDNIMSGYFENPEKTAESFDEEGYFITGDAMKFVDENDPNRGLKFDGRISDDFKLSTGTWVRATALRADLLSCMAPLAQDVVVTGHDLNEIGIMIVPNREEIEREGYKLTQEDGLIICDLLKGEIEHRLRERSTHVSGSSVQVKRAIVLAEPPSLADGEITAKGNLNFRKILTRRKNLLERLYDNQDQNIALV
ncbi:feruloyl-CoA synthase [Terasakiella pusilla]|uniref:feruloyl-CoA synthase n=1 Tax=Terasakiella pusilla TaxID=64973 RepID=UPI00048DF30D|nr:feruloyl-CoA synthase [Terasakiella pusilla]